MKTGKTTTCCLLIFAVLSMVAQAATTETQAVKQTPGPDEIAISESLAKELTSKGLPQVPGHRRMILDQIKSRTLSDSIKDIGNCLIIGLCMLDAMDSNIYGPRELNYYRQRILNNVQVIRVLEAAQTDPNNISQQVNDRLTDELSQYVAVENDYRKERKAHSSGIGSWTATSHDKKTFRCSNPIMEYERILISITSLFYIQANLHQMNGVALKTWLGMPRLYQCDELDAWLVMHYLRDSNPSVHGDLVRDNMKTVSKWNAPWPINNPMLAAMEVNEKNIPTIKILDIPKNGEIRKDWSKTFVGEFLKK